MMIEDRLKNYIETLENGTTCNDFLEQNKSIIEKIKNDSDFNKIITYIYEIFKCIVENLE